VYYRWDIGVRAGFQVSSFPVSFTFAGTSIIAGEIPPLGQFFTVQFISTRSGTNPTSLYARFTNIIDDILADHTLYDEPNGFSTYRRTGYKVYDRFDNQVWVWDGIGWSVIGAFADNTVFFVKQVGQVYQIIGGEATLIYTSGDGADLSIPEVLTYPPYGESIGKNLLSDAFSSNASITYPSAYMIAQRPGPCEDIPALNYISLSGVQAFTQLGIILDLVLPSFPAGLQVTSGIGLLEPTVSRELFQVIGQQAGSTFGQIFVTSSSIHEVPIGLSVTSNVGAFAFVSMVPLQSDVLASTTGDITPVLALKIVGNSAITAAASTIEVISTSIHEILIGIAANSVAGNLVANINALVHLSGEQSTSAVGEFGETLMRTLIGDHVVSQFGVLASGNNIPIGGQAAVSTAANFASIRTNVVNLAGIQANTAVPVASTVPYGHGDYGSGIYSGTFFIVIS
jgi:hypothetical protein